MRCKKVLKHRKHRPFVCIGGEPVQPCAGVAQVIVGYEVFGVCCHGAILLGETYAGLTYKSEISRLIADQFTRSTRQRVVYFAFEVFIASIAVGKHLGSGCGQN